MSASGRPPALRLAIDRYFKKSGVNIKPSHEVDNLGGIMSLGSSTIRGFQTMGRGYNATRNGI